MANENLYAILESRFPKDRGRTALETESGRALTYADLEAGSARLARFITALGLAPGDRVTAQVDKSPEGLILYLACLRAGLVFHPLNTAYQHKELAYFLDNAAPKLVVCRPDAVAAIEELVGRAGDAHLLSLGGDGSGSLIEASRGTPPSFATVSRRAGDLAALVYSSGTTGPPKGAMLTHRNLAANAETLIAAWGFRHTDRLLHALPVFHVHGLMVATHCALMSGASMRYLAKFDPQRVIAFLPECTVMMGVPTYYTRLLDADGFDASVCTSMRLFISGSAPLLEETFHCFRARTGHALVERYGMTETGMNTSNPLDGERKPGTVGPPLPGVEVRVVDDHGDPLAAGEVGALEVKGPNVFAGYWRMPEATADAFTQDGYLRTGDLAVIDGDGYVSIVGRAKDMIISGGLNVYPKEIELCIDALDGVVESAVFGVPHADFGEAVTAAVVAAPGAELSEDGIIAHVKGELANFKAPKRVHFVPGLPRNAMGKVEKSALRERFAR